MMMAMVLFHFIAAMSLSMMILIKMPSLVTCYGHNQTKDADMAGRPYKKGGHHWRETEYMRAGPSKLYAQ